MDASDTGIEAVLEQEQEEYGRVVKRVNAYTSKTPNAIQMCHCTSNKELLVLCNFQQPEGVVPHFITWLNRLISTLNTDLANTIAMPMRCLAGLRGPAKVRHMLRMRPNPLSGDI